MCSVQYRVIVRRRERVTKDIRKERLYRIKLRVERTRKKEKCSVNEEKLEKGSREEWGVV